MDLHLEYPLGYSRTRNMDMDTREKRQRKRSSGSARTDAPELTSPYFITVFIIVSRTHLICSFTCLFSKGKRKPDLL